MTLIRAARLRELLLLAAVAITVVALGSIVGSDLRQSARDSIQLNTRLSGGLNLIDALQFNTQEVRRILLYALHTSDANLQLQYAEQSRAASSRVERLLDEPSPLVDTTRARPPLQKIREAWDRYLVVRDEVIGLILEGSLGEGVALDEGQGTVRFDAVRSAIADLKGAFENEAAVQLRDVSLRAERSLGRLWILIVSALAASAVGIYLVNRRAALESVEVELRRARDAAEQAARAKTDFLATMSHELRTPLNAVVGIADLLDRTEMSLRQRELMRLARSSATALLGLVTDILDYSRIEAESLSLAPGPFALRLCIEDAVDAVTEPVARKGLDLGYLIDDDVPAIVAADEGRVRQVLLNLLSNAVKFTDRGEIAVHVSRSWAADGASQIVVSVRDTGRGIPEQVHSRLFQRFSQVDATLSREHGGAGLGLAISDRLARLLGGSLTFQSTPGAGSTFAFAFKADPADMPGGGAEDMSLLRGQRALILVGSGIVERQIRWLLSQWGVVARVVTDEVVAASAGDTFDVVIVDAEARERRLFEKALAFRASATDAPPGLVVIRQLRSSRFGDDACEIVKPIRVRALYDAIRVSLALPDAPSVPQLTVSAGPVPLSILLVEDDAANRRIAYLMLEELGFPTDEATSGIEAIERARTHAYDVILMDLHMPGLDGLETTRRIRAEQRGRRPTIIALTASVIQGDQVRCREAGMDGYLAKPLRLATLAEALSRVSVSQF